MGFRTIPRLRELPDVTGAPTNANDSPSYDPPTDSFDFTPVAGGQTQDDVVKWVLILGGR